MWNSFTLLYVELCYLFFESFCVCFVLFCLFFRWRESIAVNVLPHSIFCGRLSLGCEFSSPFGETTRTTHGND
jgi:hypothetical protein